MIKFIKFILATVVTVAFLIGGFMLVGYVIYERNKDKMESASLEYELKVKQDVQAKLTTICLESYITFAQGCASTLSCGQLQRIYVDGCFSKASDLSEFCRSVPVKSVESFTWASDICAQTNTKGESLKSCRDSMVGVSSLCSKYK